MREDIIYQVSVTDLQLNDHQYQFGSFTEQESRIMNIADWKIRPYEHDDNVHTSVTIEFNLNLYHVERDVYSALDWIGDVGGLNEGLSIAFAAILVLINFNSFDHYLIESLYK